MLLFILGCVYVLVNVYLILRIRRWLMIIHPVFRRWYVQAAWMIVYLLPASSPVSAYLLPESPAQVFLKKLSNYWMGTFLYILLIFLAAELIGLVLHCVKRMPRRGSAGHRKLLAAGSAAAAVLVLALSVYGSLHAKELRVKEYAVTLSKPAGDMESLRIGLISDLHLGYNSGLKDVERLVERMNGLELDLICVAGDIFDNDYDAVEQPEKIADALGSLRSTYGTYACYGNHDVEERLLGGFSVSGGEELRDPRMDAFMRRAGITVLNDEARLIGDSFYLVGRLDASKTGVAGLRRKTIGEFAKTLDMSRPVIVLEHQPRALDEEKEAGVDLALAGHTHGGQLFPGNLVTALLWENSYGLLEDGGFHSVVTSGVGTWGPNMRVGTDSEIAVVNVSFQEQEASLETPGN